ncbi:MAG TPA: class I tRNA ligase family protein [Pseudonocardiaceae bacterium]|nr:class I tRNA ligase family protein [Pseudonocardiaceae bacterium]
MSGSSSGVWQWKTESGGKILNQMRRLGDGVDWSCERFTMDTGLSRAVQTVFKRLFGDELIYRAERIINWCPRCQTALSDIEVNHSEDAGELVSIRYGGGAGSVVMATTRAEMMLGDTAVAVHPDDERDQHLVGTEIEVPLTGRRVPVVADEHVDPAFGTGAVKVTPAHAPNDFEIGRRHDLPTLTVMDERAAITARRPFEGLDRFEARPAVVAALRADGRILAEKRPYLHSVGHCSRCNTVVEPRLSLRWFVKVEPLAKAAGDAVRDGQTQIHRAVPDRDGLTDADAWIVDRLDAVVSDVDELFESFQFGKVCEALYHFVWDEFCDWYLELAKVQLADGGQRAERTRAVLGHVLDIVLRLLLPVTPFITETLWTARTARESIVVADWPTATGRAADPGAVQRISDVRKLVTELRRFRADQGLKPAQHVAAHLLGADAAGLGEHETAVRVLTRLDAPPESFTASTSLDVKLTGGIGTVELDMLGAVDPEAERKRLAKDLAPAEKDLAACDAKLTNPVFAHKAPADVVAKTQARREAAVAEIARVTTRLEARPNQ